MTSTPPAGPAAPHLSAPARRRFSLASLKVALFLAAALVVGVVFLWRLSHPTLCVVNVTESGPLVVTLDGEPLGAALPVAESEGAAQAHHLRTGVLVGEHKLEAKDAQGRVVDMRILKLEWGSSYLYAPAHDPGACFNVQTDGYGSAQVDHPVQSLDPALALWKLPAGPDYWFRDTPDSVSTKGGGAKRTALRLVACDDEEAKENGGGAAEE